MGAYLPCKKEEPSAREKSKPSARREEKPPAGKKII